MILVQLSDFHIGATWAPGVDSEAGLARAVARVREVLGGPPDAVVVTGDLADHAIDSQYERARELLAPVAAPLHVLPGNHDDRAAMRRHFGLPGSGDGPVRYAADLGPLRLIALDTTIPGEDAGALDGEQLDWLDAALAEHPDAPAVLAMHHPPLQTGVSAWDDYALAADARGALAEIVARHPHVLAILAGHLHRTTAASCAGRPVLAGPSTYAQMQLDLTAADEIQLTSEPPGFVLHRYEGGRLVSLVQS